MHAIISSIGTMPQIALLLSRSLCVDGILMGYVFCSQTTAMLV